VAVVAVLRRPRTAAAPLHGATALLAFALLAGFTAFSVVWSLAPSDSWLEASRTFAYLAVFAGGIGLARLAGDRATAVLGGVAGAALLVCAWALLTKVFPATLAADETFARLREPFEYWNAVGLMAALGVPPLLWLGARRSGHAAVNALAWPALAFLLVCLMLAYSRGTIVALLGGLAVWFALVPLRLRGAVVLAAAVTGAAPLVAWTFTQDGLTTDEAPMAARVDAGHELGALLVLMAAVLLAAGLAANFVIAQRPLSPEMRSLAGRVALTALAVIPLVGVVALSTAEGGVSGQVSKAWDQLTDTDARTPDNTPGRLTATASVRARYWDEALKVHADSPLVGVGAGGYATARTRYRKDTLNVRHAHGYGVQTLADLGWAGLALSVLAALAWCFAAARATGLRWRDRRLPYDAERIGALTLVAVVAVFAVHSLVDWTWIVPATAAAAALCAGFVAGRGPLRARLDGARPAAPARAPVWPAPTRIQRLRRRLAARRIAAVLVALLALAAAWTAYQPVRAATASDEGFDRLEAGDPAGAAAAARDAVDRNPLSVDPLFELAAFEQTLGRNREAEQALERAVEIQPANSETWRRLGRFQLSVVSKYDAAVRSFRAAYFLDPRSPQSASDVLEAARAIRSGGRSAPPATP
jgi:cytochrome c-type biogenesis protein CcmH/NrfG